VIETGGTSGSAGHMGSTGGQQASGGQAGTTPAAGGQTGTTGGQAGTTAQPASGGHTGPTTSSSQAGTTTQPTSGAQAGTAQPASGGQTGAAGQSGTAGIADVGGSVVGSGGSTTATGGRISSGGATSASGGSTTATGGRISSGGTTSASGGSTTATGGRISSGGTTSTGGLSSGGTTSSSGGSSSTSSGSTGGKPDQGSLPAITVHLAGDSTMANYAATTTQEGWGQEFGQFFISKVTIDNQAQGGANVQSFYSGKWKTLIANVQAGDYVLAAFGINDSGTTHGPVTVPDFTAEFDTMADEVAAKKATFIPTTSSPLQVWVGGKETNDRLQPYCDATIAVGKAKNLLVDDLNARGVEYYNSIGQTAAAALTFNGDKAHFDKAGATEMAQLAAQELTRIGSPLAAYLK
jgi:lysophospholipase L1-like esterase